MEKRFLVTEEMDDILLAVLQSGETVKLYMVRWTMEKQFAATYALRDHLESLQGAIIVQLSDR